MDEEHYLLSFLQRLVHEEAVFLEPPGKKNHVISQILLNPPVNKNRNQILMIIFQLNNADRSQEEKDLSIKIINHQLLTKQESKCMIIIFMLFQGDDS